MFQTYTKTRGKPRHQETQPPNTSAAAQSPALGPGGTRMQMDLPPPPLPAGLPTTCQNATPGTGMLPGAPRLLIYSPLKWVFLPTEELRQH